MTAAPEVTGRKFCRTGDVCRRYNISLRTIYRWIDSGLLPQPFYINRTLFFDIEALEQKERERMRGRDDAWQQVGDVAGRVVSHSADIRDHQRKMQAELNRQKKGDNHD